MIDGPTCLATEAPSVAYRMPLSVVSPVPVLLASQKLVPSLVTTSSGLKGTDGPVAVPSTVSVPGSAPRAYVKLEELAVTTVNVPL